MRLRMKIRTVSMVLLLSLLAGMLFLPVNATGEKDSHGLKTVTLDPDAIYNGIVIPEDDDRANLSPYGDLAAVPYLMSSSEGGYAPDIVNIDKGRQLFVDDFLVENTTLQRSYYQATLLEEPVLTGKSKDAGNAVLTSGGVFYDMDEKIYKMWYQAGFAGSMAYATSEDGVNWKLPPTSGGDGSNVLLRSVKNIAGSSVWLQNGAEDAEKYYMMLRHTDSFCKENSVDGVNNKDFVGYLYTSGDGKRWSRVGQTGAMGDRTTFYYNELLDNWIFSIRLNTSASWGTQIKKDWCRTRAYHDGDTWLEAATWDWFRSGSDNNPVFWMKTDSKDPIDKSQGNYPPQLYNLDAIAYESITLAMCQLWYGPENDVVAKNGKTKITEIQAAYSRDGFYFTRPVRGAGNALIPASRTDGTWDYGYLSTTTGGVIVYDDEIRIYYSAISNQYQDENGQTVTGPYVGGSIGYATLRRDGFASMNGSGTLTTKPLTVTKDVRYLFVNADVANGSLKAEITDLDGNVLEGYSANDCIAMTGDSCCSMMTWKNAENLSFLQNKGFKIRFVMENGELYSFWLSADPEGASGGAMAAGYAGEKDLNPDLSDIDDVTRPGTTGENTTDEKSTTSAGRGCASSLSALSILPVVCGVSFVFRKRKKARTI